MQLTAKLEGESLEKEVALDKIQHLEKLILKLTEESKAASNSNGTSVEPRPASQDASKQLPAFPDPPSEDASSKSDERVEQPHGKDTATVDAEDLSKQPLHTPVIDQSLVKHQMEQESQISSTGNQEERSWKWNVSGLWGYVTGEPNE